MPLRMHPRNRNVFDSGKGRRTLVDRIARGSMGGEAGVDQIMICDVCDYLERSV